MNTLLQQQVRKVLPTLRAFRKRFYLLSEEGYEELAADLDEWVRSGADLIDQLAQENEQLRNSLEIERGVNLDHRKIWAEGTRITPLKLIHLIAEFYGIPAAELVTKSRKAVFVEPRRMLVFFASTELDSKPGDLAYLLNRDRTSVIYLRDTGQNKFKYDVCGLLRP